MVPSPGLFDTSGFNRCRRCRHGNMVYNINDIHVGRSMDLYGEWAEAELTLLGLFLQPGDVVVEAGANVGTHTVFFARKVGPAGRVFAVEPQRMVHQALCANLALNSLVNVHAHHAAAGAQSGALLVPELDYSIAGNYGGVSLDGVTAGERVPMFRLDDLPIDRCRLVKLDVEGMELAVLEGGRALIAAFTPMLYLENNDPAKSSELIQAVQALGYDLFWHFSRFYNPQNYFGNPDNVFGSLVDANMICVPPAQARLFSQSFPRVEGPEDSAQAALARSRR